MANGNERTQALQSANLAFQQGLMGVEQFKQQNEQRLQQRFTQLQSQRDNLLKLSGNENLPDSVRQRLLNRSNQISTALGMPLIGSQGEFGQAEKDFSKATSILLTMVEKGQLPRNQLNTILTSFRQNAIEASQTGEERQQIERLFTGAQQQAFGAGAPQEFIVGGQPTLGRVTPGGQVAPISQQQVQSPAILQREQNLRKEFTDITKEFSDQVRSFNRVQASAQDPSPAGDLALIFNFMKTLDPRSVVRESEFATAENAGGIPERVRRIHNNLLRASQGKGTFRLSSSQRKDFVNRAERIIQKQETDVFNPQVKKFSNIAERQGLNPENIITQPRPQIEQQQPTTGQIRRRTKDGRIAIFDENRKFLRFEGQ